MPALIELVRSTDLTLKSCASAALMYISIDIAAKPVFFDNGGVDAMVEAIDVDDEKLCLNILQVRREIRVWGIRV